MDVIILLSYWQQPRANHFISISVLWKWRKSGKIIETVHSVCQGLGEGGVENDCYRGWVVFLFFVFFGGGQGEGCAANVLELHSDRGCTTLVKHWIIHYKRVNLWYLNYISIIKKKKQQIQNFREKEEAGEFHVSQKRFLSPSVPVRL